MLNAGELGHLTNPAAVTLEELASWEPDEDVVRVAGAEPGQNLLRRQPLDRCGPAPWGV